MSVVGLGRAGRLPSAIDETRLCGALLLVYLVIYLYFSARAAEYFPPYAWPHGDEGTYASYATAPWTLIGDIFTGYPPKEHVNPYNLRGFLTPLAAAKALFGSSPLVGRYVLLGYGALLLLATYKLASVVARPTLALACVVLLSLSWPFIYFSHVMRPEILLAAGTALGLALVVANNTRPWPRRGLVLGLLSAGLIWVHLNALFWPPMFAALLVGATPSGHRRAALRGFVLGCAAFLAVYALLNLWPARETLIRYGPWPVTFVSRSRIPLFSTDLWEHSTAVLRLYAGFVLRALRFEDPDPVVNVARMATFCLFVTSAIACLVWRRHGSTRVLAGVTSLLLVATLLLPNAKSEYTFYTFPLGFVLAAAALDRLPSVRLQVAVAALVLAVCGTSFVMVAQEELRYWRAVTAHNRSTAERIATLLEQLGPREELTVMAVQEFHVVAHAAEIRTFHSVLATANLAASLQTIAPEVVILSPRTRQLLLDLLLMAPDPRIESDVAENAGRDALRAAGVLAGSNTNVEADRQHFNEYVDQQLAAAGYVRANAEHWLWNAEPMEVYVKRAAEN